MACRIARQSGHRRRRAAGRVRWRSRWTEFALNGIVVVRNGYLVCERYYGYAPPSLFVINSVTKSVSSMLVGIALGEGKLKSIDQTVGELLPEAAAKMPSSPVIRMISRRSSCRRRACRRSMARRCSCFPIHWAVYWAARHRADPPAWAYCNASVSLLAPILARATGVSVEEYARQVLFSPLGIERFSWDPTAPAMPCPGSA